MGIPWCTFEPNLSSNGKVIDITPGPSALLTFAMKKLTFSKKNLVPLLLSPKKENLEYLVNLVKDKKLKTVIDSKHPLSKAEEAWAKSIDGHATGKIISSGSVNLSSIHIISESVSVISIAMTIFYNELYLQW
ncbi:hypothetical protein Gotur_001145 [Gossypium turneri]